MLHNPRYAGAFAYGRHRSRSLPDGRTRTTRVAREKWEVLLLDQHPGYIDWSEYERNQKRLANNTRSGLDGHQRPPREGVALLQGLARARSRRAGVVRGDLEMRGCSIAMARGVVNADAA